MRYVVINLTPAGRFIIGEYKSELEAQRKARAMRLQGFGAYVLTYAR